MNDEIREYYEELFHLCNEESEPLKRRYRKLRELLERAVRSQMKGTSLQTTDFAARLNYVATMTKMDGGEINRIHTFRITSNDILNYRKEASKHEFMRDVAAVTFALRKIFNEEIPRDLYKILPQIESKYPMEREKKQSIRKVRVCFEYADEKYLYVRSADEADSDLIKVIYNQKGINDEFARTIEKLWRFAQINLIDVTIDSYGVYTPAFIVLEPDYLIDISSLAECYRDYGNHPANYLLSRLVPIENARPLLLGNIANLFLDEWIHADDDVDYVECMKKAFRQYPIELAACDELRDKGREKEFFQNCKLHFNNIRKTVTESFTEPGYNLNKQDAVLEPSYICEALGIQGRLDYMQRDMSSFIEMKSGKADEYAIPGKIEPKENNRVQMLLYMAVLEYSMGQRRTRQHPYLLYTRYPLLYPARASWAHLRRIINLRNLIVAQDYEVQLHNNIEFTSELLSEIKSSELNTKRVSGRFWEQYLRPSIDSFGDSLRILTPVEQKYFYTLYNFITKELYTSKSGDVEYEGRSGAATLWRGTIDEKRETGEILFDLLIKSNHANDAHKAYVLLEIPQYDENFLPNFRSGDAIILYERNNNDDNVTNKLVFKGNIEIITDTEVRVRLRATQKNMSVFANDSRYAIEHDIMDSSFRTMYQGLYSFMKANPERRGVIMGQRKPVFNMGYNERIANASDDFDRIVLKAEAAADYFLLVGPPGTGKTSRALRTMVERFYKDGKQLLLMAYTNRAVDEICKSVSSIEPSINYIRVGSELSCDDRYKDRLLENSLMECNNRQDVQIKMADCRVYIGTVASISARPELFKLKRFDAAIIDEATQILEPQLIGILSSKFADGRDAVGKFILIGDHKQLPAVVLQSSEHSEVRDAELNALGLTNLKDSLFERLYRNLLASNDTNSIDMLCRQGRMHPSVAEFPNSEFYGGKLDIVGLPHQLEKIDNAVCFIPSQRDIESPSGKTNRYEAAIVAEIARKIYDEMGDKFSSDHSLGIITPYRSQIAMIRKEILSLSIPALEKISIDTVERYQGSERDVIIYSFCVNYLYQLQMLPNITLENGIEIDRKLNVALTRARKRLFITGVPELLKNNDIYKNLIEKLLR